MHAREIDKKLQQFGFLVFNRRTLHVAEFKYDAWYIETPTDLKGSIPDLHILCAALDETGTVRDPPSIDILTTLSKSIEEIGLFKNHFYYVLAPNLQVSPGDLARLQSKERFKAILQTAESCDALLRSLRARSTGGDNADGDNADDDNAGDDNAVSGGAASPHTITASTGIEPGAPEERERQQGVDAKVSNAASETGVQETASDAIFVDDSRTLVDETVAIGLGFEAYAVSVTSLVGEIAAIPMPASEMDDAPSPLLSFGIYGPWGAGKSTLLRAIETSFTRQGYFVIQVNPWKWDGRGDLHDFVRSSVLAQATREKIGWPAVLLRIRILFRENQNLMGFGAIGLAAMLFLAFHPTLAELLAHDVKALSKSAAAVAVAGIAWKLISSPVSAWLGNKLFGRERHAAGLDGLATAYKDIARLLYQTRTRHTGRAGRPLVIIFDDLDRCVPERVAAFVESVHSLVAAGAIVFIACDEDYVAAALEARYKPVLENHPDAGAFGRKFLEKIIQVPIYVPALTPEGLRELGITSARQQAAPPVDAGAVGPTVGATDIDAADDATDDTPQAFPAAAPPPLAEEKLTAIIDDVLRHAVVPLALNVRQAKSLSNTLKLYLSIQGATTSEEARRLAMFLFADRFDRAWLDARFHGHDLSTGPIGGIDALSDYADKALGNDQETLLPLYALIGRRPDASARDSLAAIEPPGEPPGEPIATSRESSPRAPE